MKNEDLKTSDDVQAEISIPIGPATFKKVKVTAEDGIFKGGKQHDQGDELVIESAAARRFEANGDVEILEDAEVEPEEQPNE